MPDLAPSAPRAEIEVETAAAAGVLPPPAAFSASATMPLWAVAVVAPVALGLLLSVGGVAMTFQSFNKVYAFHIDDESAAHPLTCPLACVRLKSGNFDVTDASNPW